MDRRMDADPAQMLLLGWGVLWNAIAWHWYSCRNPAAGHPSCGSSPKGRCGNGMDAGLLMVPAGNISGVVWIYTQWRADPRSYTQSCEEYLYFRYFATTSLCCHPLSLCSSLTPFQLRFLMHYFKFEIALLLLSSYSPRVMLLKTKSEFPAAFFKSPFPAWSKKDGLCVTKHSTGGSVPLLAFMEKEYGEITSKILSWFFGAGKAKKQPVSLMVNEDEAFEVIGF